MKKIIFLSLAFMLVAAGCSLNNDKQNILNIEEAKTKAMGFINENLMQNGEKVSIKEVIEESGLYKVVVNAPNGQEITTYLTRDGKKFITGIMDVGEVEKKNKDNESKKTSAETKSLTDVPKNDKPKVELFVMSHCPFGTQIEKGILPVLKTLGDKINFELKFCDYAMHGEKELKEQLNEYCIQKNEPQKLISYLQCFLEDEKADECLKQASIDAGKLKICVNETDKKYKIIEMFNDKKTWTSGRFPQFNVHKDDNVKYGIKGSPGLVVNGKQISSGRNPDSLLKTICAGFNDQPKECDAELSGDTPSPGFGFGKTSKNDSGGCGT